MTGIEQVAAAADAARALLAGAPSFASMTDREVVAVLGHAAELSRTLTALQVRLAGELGERSRGPADQALCRTMGHRHARAAVAAVLGIRGSAAQALLRMAALTTPQLSLTGGDVAAKYPRVAAAFDAAGISLAQAQAIVDHLEPASPRADLAILAWAEGALVDAATDPHAPLGPELLVTQARAYVAVLDPDGVLPSAERQRAMRSLKLWQQEDGMWQLRMVCPPEAAAAIKSLLDAYLSPRVRVAFRDDGEPGCDVDGAEVPHAGDGDPLEEEAPLDDRTPEQKRHDVLVGLVQAHAASGDAPVAAGEPPVLVLTGTVQAFGDYLHDRPSTDRTLTIEHTGDLVPIETIGRFLCHAALQRAVVDAEGHVLELGRAERLFTRAQRRALAVRDRGCRVRGCGIPAAWCEAHHVVWWEHGGRTDVNNGTILEAAPLRRLRLLLSLRSKLRGSLLPLRLALYVPVVLPSERRVAELTLSHCRLHRLSVPVIQDQ
ncbi:HNH endonuclease [Agrococcus sp. Marseille-P2731]|uniref:HNH endonuclease n=1 Tax=Agrococcus sp. Marseille-P2731 TaxID=1841862 RepID=UPI0009300D74|nr:HNH endonuclease signature motif containing protein [Agrococcus sp. Marseille-P2731]